ncbi:aminotransferase [Cellulomonas chitinilytica]|uniref:Aminotransferase n=1 Tax=Cellulomonas chitinilytica TaxID=398759 RepID=A0A919U097_9CELL|nr:type 1 glutamine amidotransferase [Cellulomonas chitinilytica]GIG22595.1 aminotransferase [Cellulomonas chitinilytica]
MTDATTPVLTVVQLDDGVSLDRFADWLDGVRVRPVRADLGESAGPADALDGLLVLGGQMSATSDEPGIAETRALLADAVAAGVPTLGLCLGAQLLAVATGGRVHVAAPPGRESGVIGVHWRPEALHDELVGGLVDADLPEDRRTTRMPSMHADAIVDLPRAAKWLAHSRAYPYQAFRVGSAWGLQFHPEASPATLHAWASLHDDVDTAAVDAAAAEHDEVVAGAGRVLARAFAGIVVARAAERTPA